MKTIRTFFFCNLLVIFSSFLFSQEPKFDKRSPFFLLQKKVESSKNNTLKKAYKFYSESQFDSCYIYSGKGLLNSLQLSQKEKDIFNYLQGVSAKRKKLYKKAISNLLAISNENFFSPIKNKELGFLYLAQKKLEKSIYHFLEWEKHNTNFSKSQKWKTYHNIGITYMYLKKHEEAEQYFAKVFEQIPKEDTLNIIKAKNDLANVYYSQYLDDKAIPIFKESYSLAKQYTDIESKKITANNMAIVEKNRKNYKQSVKYYQESIKWKDSIWNRDKIWELNEKDKQLAVAQKQQEIALQDEQIKRQKIVQNGLLLGASGLLIFIGGLGYFYRRLKKQKQLITEQKEELDVANKTKNYLFSVVSHDLRSPINTIKRQHKKLAKHIANNDLPAIKEANQQAISVTDSTSHLLNNVLQWSLEQSNQLNFSQEDYALQPIIEHILFDYEDVAESHNIAISTNFEDDIVVKTDKESLKIVLRNLIDNSIKYMNGAGSIEITTTTQNNQARIEIKDSGIGISEEKLQKINALKDLSVDKIDRSKGVGLGLILCQTLIKKNNGTLFFESVEGESTTAILLLPLV